MDPIVIGQLSIKPAILFFLYLGFRVIVSYVFMVKVPYSKLAIPMTLYVLAIFVHIFAISFISINTILSLILAVLPLLSAVFCAHRYLAKLALSDKEVERYRLFFGVSLLEFMLISYALITLVQNYGL